MKCSWRIGWIALVVLAFLTLGNGPAEAKIPHLIRYQGTVTDSAGVPLEGPYNLTFRIYDAETEGTRIWEEVQADVPIAKGIFSVFLGSVTSLNLVFDKDVWLSIQVSNDPEMAPRIRLTSVPTAYRAETAERAEALVNPITTSTITDDANRLVPSGAIILWTGDSCPAGYTRVSAMDGKFLVSGSTYNPTAGGSNTHSHLTPDHTHSISATTSSASGPSHGWNASKGTGTNPTDAAELQHTHSFSSSASGGGGTTGSADSRPEFATVLLCRKD